MVVDDVRAYLEAQELAGGSTAWPLSLRSLDLRSNRLVVLTEDGGPPPQMSSAVGMGDGVSRRSGLQIRVRGEPNKGSDTAAKASELLLAFHGLTGVTLGSTYYEGISSMTAEPVFMGYDEKMRPEFTVSLRLMAPVPIP